MTYTQFVKLYKDAFLKAQKEGRASIGDTPFTLENAATRIRQHVIDWGDYPQPVFMTEDYGDTMYVGTSPDSMSKKDIRYFYDYVSEILEGCHE